MNTPACNGLREFHGRKREARDRAMAWRSSTTLYSGTLVFLRFATAFLM